MANQVMVVTDSKTFKSDDFNLTTGTPWFSIMAYAGVVGMLLRTNRKFTIGKLKLSLSQMNNKLFIHTHVYMEMA